MWKEVLMFMELLLEIMIEYFCTDLLDMVNTVYWQMFW